MRRAGGREMPAGEGKLLEQFQGRQEAAMEARELSAARLLTAEELASRWQVPKAHVYRLSRSGQIPVIKLGRYLRYRLDAIEAWEEGRPHV